MSRLYCLCCCFLAFYDLYGQQNINSSLTFDGIERLFTIHLPPDHDPAEAWPLVINMHGFGSNRTEQQFYANMNPVADENGFIVVYPQGVFNSWNVGWVFGSQADDVGFIEALTDVLIADWGADPERVYATGMSNGGFMSYRLACELSDRIAAIASVTGGMVPGLADNCDPGRAVPVLQLHGTADDVVPYEGSFLTAPVDSTIAFWRGYNGCMSDSIVTEVPDLDPADGSTAQNIRFEDCTDGATVEFYRIEGGGHTWPGSPIDIGATNQDFDGSKEIWRFFSQFTLSGAVSSVAATRPDPEVRLGPNPFQDRLRVEMEGLRFIVVRDYAGRSVYAGALRSGETLLLNRLRLGMYTLELQGGERSVIKRVVKQ